MTAAPTHPHPIAPELRLLAATLAPSLAATFGVILAALRAVIARRFLQPPHDAAIIVPVWKRLNRAAQRFAALMALFAAGNLPAPVRPRAASEGKPTPQPQPAAPKPAIPTRRAWLVRALLHEAAVYGGQLQHLLSQPGVADLLATTPHAGRIIRPLAHMLGFQPPAQLRLPPRPPRPRRAKPVEPPRPARPDFFAIYDRPLPPRPPPLPPLRQLLSESGPNCPRCRLRWPYNGVIPGAKPA